MEFLIGKDVKPQAINQLGEVSFVSSAGVKPAAYTEDDCRAYGFNYLNSKCFAVAGKTTLVPNSSNLLNTSTRAEVGDYSYQNGIIGMDNILSDNTNNNLIVGDSNNIDSYISNSIVNGTKGDTKYINSQVLGGNQGDDILGERQSILLLAGADTTNSTYTRAYINDDGSTLFNVEDNSIVAYTAHTIAVRTAGTATGAKGDFKYWIERGAVVSRGGTLTLNRTRDTIAQDGTTTGWNVNSDVDGTKFYVEVKGKNNIDLKWIVRFEISEMRTGIDLS